MTNRNKKNVSTDVEAPMPPSIKNGDTTEKVQKFKEKLLDLATWFIDISPREIIKEINRSLRQVGEYWAFDRVILAELTNSGADARAIYSYTAPGVLQHFPVIELDKAPSLAIKIQTAETVFITPIGKESSTGITPDENLIAKGPIQPGSIYTHSNGRDRLGRSLY